MYELSCLKFDIVDIFRERRGEIRLRTKNKELYAIACRLKGESVFYTCEEKITVSVGDVLYVPQGATYTQETLGEDVIIVHLDMFGTSDRTLKTICTECPEEICALFLELEKVWRDKKEYYAYRCTSILYDLIARTGVAILEQHLTESALIFGVRYINDHFSDSDFSIAVACRKCNISRAYFNRLFKSEFGCTPVEYIQRLKIQKAEMLLRSGCHTNEEIAELCGFHNVKYFYAVFKKLTGSTTKAYRS